MIIVAKSSAIQLSELLSQDKCLFFMMVVFSYSQTD